MNNYSNWLSSRRVDPLTDDAELLEVIDAGLTVRPKETFNLEDPAEDAWPSRNEPYIKGSYRTRNREPK